MILDTYSAHGCYLGTVSLVCPEGKTILVTSAVYGQFSYECLQTDIECCPPHIVDDCTESMEDAAPGDWLLLKEVCDGQVTCELPMNGGALNTCSAPMSADYATVFYQCVPGKK